MNTIIFIIDHFKVGKKGMHFIPWCSNSKKHGFYPVSTLHMFRFGKMVALQSINYVQLDKKYYTLTWWMVYWKFDIVQGE